MNEPKHNLFLGNTAEEWLLAATILALSFLAIFVFRRIILKQLSRWSLRTQTTVDDFLISVIKIAVIPALYVAACYFAVTSLKLAPQIARVVEVAFLFAVTFFTLRIISTVVREFVHAFINRQENREAKEKQARGLLILVNVAIWIVGLIFLIDNLGYNVTSLLTGLGIGGIAIALAAQTVLGDLFSYFVIFFDRPFEIGDFIVVEDKMGTVEYVGIKTTRLRTLSGEQLVCSNTYLTNSRVHNYKRMERRRVVFKLGVTYQTPPATLARIPELVREIITSKSDLTFDRAHFAAFGDSSLDFEFVYYIESPDFNHHMDKQQAVFLDIATAFDSAGISFAFPSRSLYLETPVSVSLEDKRQDTQPRTEEP